MSDDKLGFDVDYPDSDRKKISDDFDLQPLQNSQDESSDPKQSLEVWSLDPTLGP